MYFASIIRKNGPPAIAVGPPSPDRREDELHRGEGGEDQANHETGSAEMLAVGRNQGDDDPEPDEVNEDGEKDNKDGWLSHGVTTENDCAVSG